MGILPMIKSLKKNSMTSHGFLLFMDYCINLTDHVDVLHQRLDVISLMC